MLEMKQIQIVWMSVPLPLTYCPHSSSFTPHPSFPSFAHLLTLSVMIIVEVGFNLGGYVWERCLLVENASLAP